MSEATTHAPAEAIAVLRTFLDAGMRKDYETMKTCLTRATLESGGLTQAGPENVRFELGAATREGDAWVVPVKAIPLEAPADMPPEALAMSAMVLPAILVQEDGQWKFDLNATMERMMGGVQSAMQQVGTAMGQAMGEAMQGMGQALSQAFGESGSSTPPNWLNADPSFDPAELLEPPEMMPLPKLEAALSAICRHPVRAGAATKDLLRQVGSDDVKTLMDWFDDQLFAGWTSMVALLANRHPFIARLEGFRIEAASFSDQRTLIRDGSELVYRMFISNTDGYYSDEQINILLPGVLAALPDTPDPLLAGKRTLHTDEENVDFDFFQSRVVPRTMRQICEILGREIALELDWGDPFIPAEDGRQYYRWGLNRVHGGIALACRQPARLEELRADLVGIRVKLVLNNDDRYIQYEDGWLNVGILLIRGEAGCFYEVDYARALAGEKIGAVVEATDDPSTQAMQEPDEDADEAARARELNDENFRSAAASLKENEPTWAMSLTYIFGHETAVELNFDSLAGDYALVQPFIHQGLTAVLEALPQAVMDKSFPENLVKECQKVIISGTRDQTCTAQFDGAALRVTVPLKLGDARPPKDRVLAALRSLSTTSAATSAPKQPAGDLYAQAATAMQNLEAALKESNLWPGEPPPGEIEVRGAFGSENMAFTQWLAWILIPRVNDIIQSRGTFPNGSQVAAYATREFDGVDEAAPVLDVLRAFDHLFN